MRQIPDSGPAIGEYMILCIPIHLEACMFTMTNAQVRLPHASCFPIRHDIVIDLLFTATCVLVLVVGT